MADEIWELMVKMASLICFCSLDVRLSCRKYRGERCKEL